MSLPPPDSPDTSDYSEPEIPLKGLRGRVYRRLNERGVYKRWVLLAALTGMFAGTFPVTILAMSLGSIAKEFDTTITTITWVMAGPMLLSAISLPLLVKLGDLYGHRRVYLIGFGLASLTALATTQAWSAYSLIGLRVLAAVVGGATGPTAMALIFSVYPPNERVGVMGWWSMVGAAAPAMGLILGGPLVDWLGWRIVFAIQSGLSLGVLAFASFILPETKRKLVKFDLQGSLMLAVGIGGFMFAVGQLRSLGLQSPYVQGALVLSLIGIALFIRTEKRVAEPLVSLEYFKKRNFSAPIVSSAFMAAAYMGAFVIAPLVLTLQFKYSITIASYIMLSRTLSLTISSPIGGTLGSRFGPRTASVLGCVVMTVGLGLLAWGVAITSLPVVMLGLMLQGVGYGFALPSYSSTVSNCVPEEDLGIASAMRGMTGAMGAAFGVTVLSIISGGDTTGASFKEAFALGTGLSLLAFIAAVFMSNKEDHETESSVL